MNSSNMIYTIVQRLFHFLKAAVQISKKVVLYHWGTCYEGQFHKEHSKKRKREAAKLDNQFTKVVKDNIVTPHYLNKDYEAPKEFAAAYENGRDADQLTIEEARYINGRAQTRKSTSTYRGYSQVEKEAKMKNYGYLPGVWSPSPTPSEDNWYSDYARKQRTKSYY